jgi:type I restriction enzyme S subunit
MDAIKARANGTTFLEVSKSAFRPIPCLVPTDKVLDAFVQQVEPFHRRLVTNMRESETLVALRDMLLPKLLSGEVRVGAAEKMVEAAS